MKALISPKEKFNLQWISGWDEDTPVYSEILDCARVAEVEADNKTFEVTPPLYWIDCPENCVADHWYYKDGQVYPKPHDAPTPEQGE